MNFAIEHTYSNSPFLVITGRKNSLKHRLIHVVSGLMLIRLGKQEYVVEEGQYFWLPFDCLVATTCLPNSHIENVFFSARLNNAFPKQAGFVQASALLQATLERVQEEQIPDDYIDALNQVLKYECTALKPILSLSPLSEKVSAWTAKDSNLVTEVHICLLIREAYKMKLSGKKDDAIANALFDGKTEQFEILYQALIG
ncbi:AraC family transcriptional regulator [Vibrio sp. FNV 38]|nr:AraC family transcriptional regulator [Vibrio sp. FNV 38]